MAQPGRSKRKETLVAQVFLRSVSGRSYRELAQGPLPDVLAPSRPSDDVRGSVQRFLEQAGFKVYRDEMGLALSIEASPALYAKLLGLAPGKAAAMTAAQTIRLTPPKAIAHWVDEILLTPKPELF